MSTLRRLACKVSEGTVVFFADAFAVLVLILLSAASGVFTVISRTELALTLWLSILALAITSAILYVGERREVVASKRDEALHAKIDELLRALPGADERLAGCESEEELT